MCVRDHTHLPKALAVHISSTSSPAVHQHRHVHSGHVLVADGAWTTTFSLKSIRTMSGHSKPYLSCVNLTERLFPFLQKQIYGRQVMVQPGKKGLQTSPCSNHMSGTHEEVRITFQLSSGQFLSSQHSRGRSSLAHYKRSR